MLARRPYTLGDDMGKNDRTSLGISGSRATRDITNDEGAKRVKQISSSSPGNIDSDQAKYAYAVSLASEDMGDDLDTDSAEFLDKVDSYYSQMDPETSASEMRGENPFGTAVRNVRMGIEGINDVGGDLIKGAWDLLAGGAGSLAGMGAEALGVDNAAEDWGDAARSFLSDDAADVIMGIGSDIAIAAIPGLGLPLSIGKGLIENSDDLYEAVTGRDDITLQQLSGNQRLGRGLSGTLGTVLSVLPAVGKAGNVARAGARMGDTADAAESAIKAVEKIEGSGMVPPVSVDDLLNVQTGAAQAIPGTQLDTVLKGYMPEASDAFADRAARIAGGYGTGTIEGLKSAGGGFRNGVSNVLSSTSREYANPIKRFASGYRSGSGSTYRDMLNNVARDRMVRDAEKAAENAAPIRRALGDAIGDNGVGGILSRSAEKKAAKKAAEMAKSAVESGTIDPSTIYRSNPLASFGGTVLNMASGIPMAYFNYMGSTGDADISNLIDRMQGQDLMSYVVPAFVGSSLGSRASSTLGLNNISGRMPSMRGGAQSARFATMDNLGGLYNGYGQQLGVTPEEIVERLESMVSEDDDER